MHNCPECNYPLTVTSIPRPNCTRIEYRCPECGFYDADFTDIVVKAISQDSSAHQRKQAKLKAHMRRFVASHQERARQPERKIYTRILDEDE